MAPLGTCLRSLTHGAGTAGKWGETVRDAPRYGRSPLAPYSGRRTNRRSYLAPYTGRRTVSGGFAGTPTGSPQRQRSPRNANGFAGTPTVSRKRQRPQPHAPGVHRRPRNIRGVDEYRRRVPIIVGVVVSALAFRPPPRWRCGDCVGVQGSPRRPPHPGNSRPSPTVPARADVPAKQVGRDDGGRPSIRSLVPRSLLGETNKSPLLPRSLLGETNKSPLLPRSLLGETNKPPLLPRSLLGETNKPPLLPRSLLGETNKPPLLPRSLLGETNKPPLLPRSLLGETNGVRRLRGPRSRRGVAAASLARRPASSRRGGPGTRARRRRSDPSRPRRRRWTRADPRPRRSTR
ncbi:hypothetical protein SAMN05428934_10180 [Tessaracoccus flavus]|nr:hypothetical protein SAMN05428934_10180 [Tessaracoccus flavus]